jgi:hypothetical protein
MLPDHTLVSSGQAAMATVLGAFNGGRFRGDGVAGVITGRGVLVAAGGAGYGGGYCRRFSGSSIVSSSGPSSRC